VLRRIRARIWPPGARLPNEADLAREFGVARATVNRALQSLADSGLIERRRRAGSHVTENPVRRAVLTIPVIRAGIEAAGGIYAHRLLARGEGPAPPDCGFGPGPHLHLAALHLADGRTHAHEDRWVNLAAAPGIREVDLEAVSANEWLVGHAPFTRGDYALSARPAGDLAGHFACPPGTPLLAARRRTWAGTVPVTRVDLVFAPGHRVEAEL